MTSLEKIRRLWAEFRKKPFPEGLAGEDINGVCVTSLDTFAAGCVDTYVCSGSLDRVKRDVLESSLVELDRILPELEDYPREYFLLLKEICISITKDG
ncbi:MAG: hypothetical protein JW818_15575 [Pirellulales bacterium]|nr:hypothetical protein [Pirellulales bacterium]